MLQFSTFFLILQNNDAVTLIDCSDQTFQTYSTTIQYESPLELVQLSCYGFLPSFSLLKQFNVNVVRWLSRIVDQKLLKQHLSNFNSFASFDDEEDISAAKQQEFVANGENPKKENTTEVELMDFEPDNASRDVFEIPKMEIDDE